MAYPSGVTETNVLLKLELNRQTESNMKVLLMQDSKTELVAAYTALIANLTADKAVVEAADHVNELVQ